MPQTTRGRIVAALFVVVILLLVGAFSFFFFHAKKTLYQTPEESNLYVRFDMEAYDAINENYWITPGNFAQFNTVELPELFELALKKEGISETLATSTRDGTALMLFNAVQSATSTAAKEGLAIQTLQLVLYNLPPLGRDELLSQAQQTALRDDVANVNPGNDLYQNLGLPDGTSSAAVSAAYIAKSKALEATTSSAGKAELEQIAYANEVLTNPAEKELYDTQHVEPSVFPHVLGHTLYLDFDKIAPTTLDEFAVAVDAASTTPGLDSMIIDLRGNVGGDLSFAQAFLGLFIGNNQYAFDLYHQGNDEVQRTTEPEFTDLSRYRNIAVLSDDMTQSTAELTAATLKRYRIASIVGTKTRGWGSVENTYPLQTVIDPSTSYSLLLVNSLTLGDTEEPIEENGVLPDVDTSVTNWQKELPNYFTSPSIITALTEEATSSPLR